MTRCVCIVVAVLAATIGPSATRAVGVYEDADGGVAFLLAPRAGALEARVVRSEDERAVASMFVLSATVPVGGRTLVRVEQPWVVLDGDDGARSGFGDVAVRARTALFDRPGRSVRLTGGVRLGSGSTRFYPYASQSLDVGVGVAVVDTTETLVVWGEAGGTAVWRRPDGLPADRAHGGSVQLRAGVEVTLGPRVALRVGGSAMRFSSARSRDLYLASIVARWTETVSVRVSAHAEAGADVHRASDTAVTVALRVAY